MALRRSSDDHFMRMALDLAREALGTTSPNPAVGCVIVRDGRIVGKGATAAGGRPHAETIALARARGRARNATAYVSFEPCSHQGKTPSCARALIEAGVSRVVAGCIDPYPRRARARNRDDLAGREFASRSACSKMNACGSTKDSSRA